MAAPAGSFMSPPLSTLRSDEKGEALQCLAEYYHIKDGILLDNNKHCCLPSWSDEEGEEDTLLF